MENNKQDIELFAQVDRILYPKGNDYSDFKVVSFRPIEGQVDEINISAWGNFVAKGIMPDVFVGGKYRIILSEEDDNQWGKQYIVEYISIPENFKTDDGRDSYLRGVLTEHQYDLVSQLDDPFEVIANGDLKTLTSIKGIGMGTAKSIIEKFGDNYANAEVYVQLDGLGLTPSLIKKLLKLYKDPSEIRKVILNEPYSILNKIDGVGFKTIDKIALDNGMYRLAPQRVESCIEYLMDEKSNIGMSYLTPEQLIRTALAYLSREEGVTDELQRVVVDSIENLIDEDVIVSFQLNEKNVFMLKYVRDLEIELAKEFIRLDSFDNKFDITNWEEKIDELEDIQGWDFTEQQREGIKTALESQVVVVTGLGGCVDKDTEFFNGKEWKKISEYKKGDKVLQYGKDRVATLVEPKRYIKVPEKHFHKIKTKSNHINQLLSSEHDIVYETSKGNLAKKKVTDFIDMHNKSKYGFSGKFLTTFDYSGKGIDLSDEEIRVMVAVLADGYFRNQTNLCIISLTKERKKERIQKLLEDANIKYRVHYKKANGTTQFVFYAPLRVKEYPVEWYNCSKEQLEIIAEECLYWDGSVDKKGRMAFSTTIKSDADFIQFVFSAIGKRATISTCDRRGEKRGKYIRKSIEYDVIITQRNPEVSLVAKTPEEKIEIETVPSIDGYKYCFEVPSGMLVLRRDDRIFITGNSGKTSIISGMLEVIKNQATFRQCALSGRASVRMSEATGYEGFTIHRLLGYSPEIGGFSYHKKNKLPYDIIIVDEISMIGSKLFYDLVSAINDGAKLIMIGDIGQLESIGMGNVAKDLIDSNVIDVVNLTQIHRQAQKSAIITESINIRNGKDITNGKLGNFLCGELEDLEQIITQDNKNTVSNITKMFKRELKNGKDINDLQVLVPMRVRGELSTNQLNPMLQNIYNPSSGLGNEKSIKINGTEFRVGDKVLNTKNNYEVPIYSDNNELMNEDDITRGTVSIFNGDIGTIEDILLDGELVIKFTNQTDRVIFAGKDRKSLDLAYAITCHKLQGSECDTVIIGIDYSAYYMLSKEWLYTAITRASKKCILCGQQSAIQYASSRSNVSNKQTIMKEVLELLAKNR